jgi:chaperonin GroEL (HSP60 family)
MLSIPPQNFSSWQVSSKKPRYWSWFVSLVLTWQLGDATNLVVVLGGELLTLAQDLLRMGLHPPDIISGYELGRDYALQALESTHTS